MVVRPPTFGSGFADVLSKNLGKAHTAALIAVRSARYAARPWCRRELSLFRRPMREEATVPTEAEHWRLSPMRNAYMEVADWPGVWALGDCAMIPAPTDGKFYPPTAQHAEAESKILAGNIRAAIRGGDKKPFVFQELGKVAVIGRRRGVANVFGIDFSGLIAWMMWRALNLSPLLQNCLG